MYFFANWKASVNGSRAVALAQGYARLTASAQGFETALFPSAIDFHAVREVCKGTGILLGAQSVGFANMAAQTGELSPRAAKAAGARYVLVGHSERRHLFGESDEVVARRFASAFQGALTPVLCIGETASQRQTNQANQVVQRQLSSALNGVVSKKFLVAYEPVWAIGAGTAASEAEVKKMHTNIRAALIEIIGEKGKLIPILYGGSVHAKNISALLKTPEVAGVLIGTASASLSSARALIRSLN